VWAECRDDADDVLSAREAGVVLAGFNTGELAEYDIKVPSAIGRLKGIRLIRAAADNSNSCSGWFVERVRPLFFVWAGCPHACYALRVYTPLAHARSTSAARNT
jgi:hypothetical protein